MANYVCSVCGFVYDEANGMPEAGISPGTMWGDLPDDWFARFVGRKNQNLRNRVNLLQFVKKSRNR